MKKAIMHTINVSFLFALAIVAASSARAQGAEVERIVGSLGYRVTSKISAAGADWELRDFKMREKTIISVKSKAKVPGERNMYYRYSIRIEEFGSEDDASKRINHIEATPPGPDSKMVGPEFGLRVGFRRGNRVYVVETDVYKFVVDKSLESFKDKLESRVK